MILLAKIRENKLLICQTQGSDSVFYVRVRSTIGNNLGITEKGNNWVGTNCVATASTRSSMVIATKVPSPGYFTRFKLPIARNHRSRKMAWSIRSAADGGRLNSSTNDANGGTRLIRAIQSLQVKLNARIKELRKNFPAKLLFFLVGFYCATAFATVIGQTGDWDVLSAALTVAVVEGIGALMYKSSLPLMGNMRNWITMCNYWKVGLCLGLFLDSFKY